MKGDFAGYVDAIEPEYRPLFDRLHGLVLEEHPEAQLLMLYKMPAYKVEGRRLFIAQRGLSTERVRALKVDVRHISEAKDAEVLFWVGCAVAREVGTDRRSVEGSHFPFF